MTTVRRVVLVGAGHAHVEVLRQSALNPPPNAELLLIVDQNPAIYSGMVPGFVAGQYTARDLEEYANGHVPGAVNVPYDELASRLGESDGSRQGEIVVYCERGGCADRAARTLESAGFTSIRYLAGDMSAWRAAELPTE